MLCPEEISIDLIYLTLLCLWALLRPGHGTIHLEWQPLFISPSYWNKWQACSHFHSLCKISAVHFIFLYSSLLSLIFSYAQAFTFSLLPLLSIFITLMHKHSFSFFLLNLSCCLSPTLHILSLSLSLTNTHTHTHTRVHANSRTQLYALHMVAAAVVLISSGSIICLFFCCMGTIFRHPLKSKLKIIANAYVKCWGGGKLYQATIYPMMMPLLGVITFLNV